MTEANDTPITDVANMDSIRLTGKTTTKELFDGVNSLAEAFKDRLNALPLYAELLQSRPQPVPLDRPGRQNWLRRCIFEDFLNSSKDGKNRARDLAKAVIEIIEDAESRTLH